MANFAPPMSRDGFVYQGQLFADVGNFNRHPRASVQELIELLRPKKPGNDVQSKDQVGHWYFAQLKHYGLPTTKDKNAAKVRLLNAINGGRIEVPKDVKMLESRLKKEYDTANKKARAELKVGESTAVPPAATAKNKRKRSQDEAAPKKAPATKKAACSSNSMPVMPHSTINVGSNGGININIAYQEFLGNIGDTSQTTPKKATKNTTAKTTTSKSTALKSVSSAITTQKKTTAKSATTKPAATKSAATKSAATKSTAAKPKAGSSKNSTEKGSAAPRKNGKPKANATSPQTKEANKRNASAAPSSTAQRRTSGVIKQGKDYLKSSGAATPFDNGISQFPNNHDQSLNHITGIYDVRCNIEDDFPAFCENGCRMMLCREYGTGRIWGSFAFGPFFGIVQMNAGPTRFSQDSLSLGWRAKDIRTDDLEFRRSNTGNMVFWGVNEVSGQIFDLFGNAVQFHGRRQDGPDNCGYSPSQFESEWACYPAAAYGRMQPDNRVPHGSEIDGSESNHRASYDSEFDDGDSYDSEPDHGQLYDEGGDLRPTGRYEDLMRQSLGCW